jgi:hypothetical protein
MSIKIVQLIWNAAPYKDSLLLTFLALADSANDAGFCWPSIQALAQKTRQSERNVRYLLRKLEADNAIFVNEQRGRNHTNTYQINFEYLQNLHDNRRLSGNDKPAKVNLQNLQNRSSLISSPSSPLPSPPVTSLSIPSSSSPGEPSVKPLKDESVRGTLSSESPKNPGDSDLLALISPADSTDDLPITVDDLIEGWNTIPGSEDLSPVTDVGRKHQSLRKKVQLRLREHPERAFWERVLNKCWQSAFLCGQNKTGWKATFCWLVDNDHNAVKVYEGNYDDMAERHTAQWPGGRFTLSLGPRASNDQGSDRLNVSGF